MLECQRSFLVNTHVTLRAISRVNVNETLQCLLSILIIGKWAIIFQIGFVRKGLQYNTNKTVWFYVKMTRMMSPSDTLDLSKFLCMKFSFPMTKHFVSIC
jgi:hypothetical protein